MLYDYEGVTATSTQFYLTDSVENFLGVHFISIQKLMIQLFQLITLLRMIFGF